MRHRDHPISIQAKETPIPARPRHGAPIQDSFEFVPETSPIKEDNTESEEFRTAQETFPDNDNLDYSPVPGRQPAKNGFVASSFPPTTTRRRSQIHSDDEEDNPAPPRKKQRMQSVESTDLGRSRITSPCLTTVGENDESHRVFARFKDTKGFYYPASVLEPPSILPTDDEAPLDTEVAVIFDDDSEANVSLRHIARLSLQEADIIKVEKEGVKNVMYVVQRCEFKPEGKGGKDIEGNNTVIVTPKNSKNSEILSIPIDNICLNGALFTKFLNRRYLFTKESLRARAPISSRQVSSSPNIVRSVKPTSQLFKNMVFAITIPQKDNGVRETLTRTILLHSGNIVEEGFHEMFIPFQGDLELHSEWTPSTFCAVIAETYSRRPKHMQALALGIPCLASRWIETCINKVHTPISHQLMRIAW
jgi:hypothetical protein